MSFDYSSRALSRVIAQYRNDTKLRDFLIAFANMVNTKFEIAADVRRLIYSIDDMSGVQLDLIGRVLVQPRPVVINLGLDFFGYLGTPGATPYNDAPYYDYASASDVLVPLPDPGYRLLLKSKAARNVTYCTIDQIIEISELLTGDSGITLTNNQDMTFELTFSQSLDAYTILLLDNFNVIPVPAGVSFAGYTAP